MATAGFSFMGTGAEGYDPFGSFIESSVNSYFDKKSEKRAFKRQLRLMEAQYQYAQRYAENSPSWNVKGLRDAGLNPILAVSNGVNLGSTIPSAPSAPSHKPTPSTSKGGAHYDPLISRQLSLLDSQIKGQEIKNENESKNMGLSGRDATYARIFNELKDSIGPDNFSKLSSSTLESIKSLFDSPDKYESLFGSAIPNKPIISEDTPPSMSVYTDSRPSKPYFDTRTRPRSLSIGERVQLDRTLRQRNHESERRKSKKVFHFNEEFEKFPNWRKHMFR